MHTLSVAGFRRGSPTVDIHHPRRTQAAHEGILILLQLVCRAAVLDVTGLETARWIVNRVVCVRRTPAAGLDRRLSREGKFPGVYAQELEAPPLPDVS